MSNLFCTLEAHRYQGIKGNEIQHPGEENNINNNNIITKRLHPPASAPAKLQDCVIIAPGRLHLLSTAPGSSWKSQATAWQPKACRSQPD